MPFAWRSGTDCRLELDTWHTQGACLVSADLSAMSTKTCSASMPLLHSILLAEKFLEHITKEHTHKYIYYII